MYFLVTGEPTDEFKEHLGHDVILVSRDELLDSIDIPELRGLVEAALPVIDNLVGSRR